MRVITGKYGGRSIKGKMPSGVRPTTDKSRESLFSTLDNYLYFDEKKVLDCYAGSGLVGIEFLSRGASHCTFIEKNYKPISLLNQFVNEISIPSNDYKVVKSDVIKYLEHCQEKYNIIFSDAPYKEHTANRIIDIVANNNLLEKEGFLVIETEESEEINYSNQFALVKQKAFGISKITILEYTS